MSNNPQKLHRQTIRLPGYDYSQPGAYFITLVTNQRTPIFGTIIYDQMILEPLGEVIKDEWLRLPERFKHITLDAWVIMPNHFHGIIVISEEISDLADGNTIQPGFSQVEQFGKPVKGSIPTIIRSYKSSVTQRIQTELIKHGQPCRILSDPINFKNLKSHSIWQRNYYEHIIRDEKEWGTIRAYIENNPDQWVADILHYP